MRRRDRAAQRSARRSRRGEPPDVALLRAPGLADRVAAKLAEVEARIADLGVIRDTLRTALDFGCADLATCAHEPSCPIPFTAPADDASCGSC